MRLSSILWMVVTPLFVAVGAVLLLTPSDILRQPVIDVAKAAPRVQLSVQRPAKAVVAADVLVPQIMPATLTVVASIGTFHAAPPAAAPAANKPAADRRWITASSLNLRTGPGTGNRLVGSLPFGTEVVVLDTSGTWAEVEAGSITGWLSANFLADRQPTEN